MKLMIKNGNDIGDKMTEEKTDVEDIIGIVKAKEPINCVELKKSRDHYFKLKDDLEKCRCRKQIVADKLKKYQDISRKHRLYSPEAIDEFIDQLLKENQQLNGIIKTEGYNK